MGLFLFFVVYFCIPLSLGFRENRHSRGSFFSIPPWRIGLPSGESTVTSCLLNTTVQFASQMGPTPISVLVKVGMMYPVVGKSAANWGIGRVAVATDVATCPLPVPNLIVLTLVASGPCGAFGAIYRCVAP